MAIKFRGKPIPGDHSSLVLETPRPEVRMTKYFGIPGESVIMGFTGGRLIHCEIWVGDNYVGDKGLKKLLKKLDQIDLQVELFGTLEGAIGTAEVNYEHCHMVAFDRLLLPGQTVPEPVITTDGDWVQYGRLIFYQAQTR